MDNQIRPTTIRRLPVEEWHKLDGLPYSKRGKPDPDACVVVVAEDDHGAIVGTWVLVFAPFLECLWVAEPYQRKSSVAWRMVQFMKKFIKGWKIDETYTVVQSEYVLQLAKRVGFEVLDGHICRLVTEKD